MSDLKNNIKLEVSYNSNSIVSKKLIAKTNGNVTIFSFDKNESISPHKAPFDALIIIMEGKANVKIEEEEFNLEQDDYIILPANKTHAIFAVEKFKMILVMIKE